MQTEGQTFEGDVDFSIRSLADQYYLRLDELKVTGETLKQFEPMIEKYLDKWLLVDSNFIPEDIRQLQQKDEETLAKEEQLKQLFIKSKLFYVDREYGIETVNGEKVYHYGIKFDSDGVKEYLRKAAVIDGRALTETEVEEAAKIASYITNAELWIGVDDYFLYKGVADLTGGVVEEDVDMEINISMEGKDYNKDIDIMAPEDAENFNPLELLMAYSTVELESEDGDLNLPGGEPTEEELLEAIKAFEEAGTVNIPDTGGRYKLEAHACARMKVESQLKSPSSADFPLESYKDVVTYTKNNEYSVSSYVDAENSFGATVRNDFVCTLQISDSDTCTGYCLISE